MIYVKSSKIGVLIIAVLTAALISGCSLSKKIFKSSESESKTETIERRDVGVETTERIEAFIPGYLFESLITGRPVELPPDSGKAEPDSGGSTGEEAAPKVERDEERGGVTITVDRTTKKTDNTETETVKEESEETEVKKEAEKDVGSGGIFSFWGGLAIGGAVIIGLIIFLKIRFF